MIKKLTEAFILTLVLTLASGVAAPTTTSADNHGDYAETMKTLNQEKNYGVIAQAFAKSAEYENASSVQTAFLKAKKAFHTARQNIQAIKKGDESPKKDVPCFFCDEEEDSDDDFEEDEPELQA